MIYNFAMDNHEIHMKLKAYGKIKWPFNKFVATMAKIFMPSLGLLLKLKKANFKKIKLKDKYNYNSFVVYPKKYNGETLPLYFYLHGGGFCYKTNPAQLNVFLNILKDAHSIGVIVDYSVIKRYPIPNNETLKVFDYIFENADKYRINKYKICVSGDSAGGFLALDLAYKRYENIAGLLLYFPVVYPKMETESMKLFTNTAVWNSISNKKMWDIYLGNNELNINENIDYSHFPKIYLETCEFDCLRDEGIALKDKLISKNCDVEYHFIKGVYHGFDSVSSSPIVQEAIKNREQFLLNCVREK